jgi:YVTN family beta-propeller protein
MSTTDTVGQNQVGRQYCARRPQFTMHLRQFLGLLFLAAGLATFWAWELPAIAADSKFPPSTMTPAAAMPSSVADCTCGPDAYEPDDVKAAAKPLPINSVAQVHTFHVRTDVDWYRFDDLIPGRSYRVETSQLVDGVDTYMMLYDPAGTLLRSNDDLDTARCLVDPQYCASRITWQARASGPYHLNVRTLTYPLIEPPDCPCPSYQIAAVAMVAHIPFVSGPPKPTPTPSVTPTPTPTSSPTATNTPTPTYTPTATHTPTSSPTPTYTPTPTITPTEFPTVEPVTISLPAATHPNSVAVNAFTHRAYVTSRDDDRLYMIDGLAMQVLDSAKVGDEPWGVAVNETRNRVYVLGFADGSLTTLDGATLAILNRQVVGGEPTAIRVDPVTGRIFVVLYRTNSLAVLDGNTDPPVLVDYVSTRAYGSWGIAFNPALNRVYVGGRDSQTITTLDGNNGWRAMEDLTIGTRNGCVPYSMEYVRAYEQLFVACAPRGTNVEWAVVYRAQAGGLSHLTTRAIGSGGSNGGGGIAVNPATNYVFITNSLSDNVSIMSAGNLGLVIRPQPVGLNPFGVAVDRVTGNVFVVNRESHTISVFPDPAVP